MYNSHQRTERGAYVGGITKVTIEFYVVAALETFKLASSNIHIPERAIPPAGCPLNSSVGPPRRAGTDLAGRSVASILPSTCPSGAASKVRTTFGTSLRTLPCRGAPAEQMTLTVTRGRPKSLATPPPDLPRQIPAFASARPQQSEQTAPSPPQHLPIASQYGREALHIAVLNTNRQTNTRPSQTQKPKPNPPKWLPLRATPSRRPLSTPRSSPPSPATTTSSRSTVRLYPPLDVHTSPS